jgi:NADP-dependent 3-hydroxy acid dehydrogenase YdfG
MLKNKVAVITGASSGIGKAIALELANQSVQLCLIWRHLDKLEQVAEVAKTAPKSQILTFVHF